MDNIDKLKMMEGYVVESVEDITTHDYEESYKINFSNGMSLIFSAKEKYECPFFDINWVPNKRRN